MAISKQLAGSNIAQLPAAFAATLTIPFLGRRERMQVILTPSEQLRQEISIRHRERIALLFSDRHEGTGLTSAEQHR